MDCIGEPDRGPVSPSNTSSTRDSRTALRTGLMAQTEDEAFGEVRLVRDLLRLLWDMAIRPQTWNLEVARASFGFYREAAAYKLRRAFR